MTFCSAAHPEIDACNGDDVDNEAWKGDSSAMASAKYDAFQVTESETCMKDVARDPQTRTRQSSAAQTMSVGDRSGDGDPGSFQARADQSDVVRQLKQNAQTATRAASGVVQRVCYSIANGDQTTGSEVPGSAFSGEIVDGYYQRTMDLAVRSHEADQDEETNEAITRQRQLTPLVGNVDHIVPANLGGGGLEGNSRALRADHNQARGDNFFAYNNNHPLGSVRVVHGGNEYTSAKALVNAGATHLQVNTLKGLWNAPWSPAGPLNEDRGLG